MFSLLFQGCVQLYRYSTSNFALSYHCYRYDSLCACIVHHCVYLLDHNNTLSIKYCIHVYDIITFPYLNLYLMSLLGIFKLPLLVPDRGASLLQLPLTDVPVAIHLVSLKLKEVSLLSLSIQLISKTYHMFLELYSIHNNKANFIIPLLHAHAHVHIVHVVVSHVHA